MYPIQCLVVKLKTSGLNRKCLLCTSNIAVNVFVVVPVSAYVIVETLTMIPISSKYLLSNKYLEFFGCLPVFVCYLYSFNCAGSLPAFVRDLALDLASIL